MAQGTEQHQLFLNRMKNHSRVEQVRTLGIIFAMTVKTENPADYYGNFRNKLYAFFIEQGVILRPVGNTIYLVPPYITSNDELEIMYQTIEKALEIV